jgi:hypothetical protein
MTIFGFSLSRAAHSFGWTLAIAGIILAVVLLGVSSHLLGPKSVSPVIKTTEIKVAPASGVEGFDVGPFCVDDLTSVKAFPAPDSNGTTYQLTRVAGRKTETVTLVLGPDGGVVLATHYVDSSVGQISEPAFLNGDGRSCVEKKAK